MTNTKLAETLRHTRSSILAWKPDESCPMGQQMAKALKRIDKALAALAAHDAEQAKAGQWVATVEVVDGEPVDYETVPGFSLPDGDHRLYTTPVEQAMFPKHVSGTSEQAAKAVPALCVNCEPAGKCEKRQAMCAPGMAAKAVPAGVDWRSVANECVDELANAYQGLRNIQDGISSAHEVLSSVKSGIDRCMAHRPAAPTPPAPESPPDTEAVTACWQDFGRTEEFRRAVKWSQDGEIPGALFVAFRAGLRAASPKALCNCGKKPAAECDKWEPGCDLGQSPEHARVVRLDEAQAAPEAQQAEPHNTGEIYGRNDGLRLALHGRVAVAGYTPVALADLLFASDEVMALNADLGLTMDQLTTLAKAMLTAAQIAATGAPAPAQQAAEQELPPLQAGMTNTELAAAWKQKLPGVEPTYNELSAFALGAEVGFARAALAQRRERLTDEQILALSCDLYDGTLTNPLIQFARAIERAHGIGATTGEQR